jgi:hypothetical protein
MTFAVVPRTLLAACSLGATLVSYPARASDCEDSGLSKPEPNSCAKAAADERAKPQAAATAGAEDRVAEAHFFGVRGTETWSRGIRATDRDLGVTASARHFDYDSRGWFSGRSVGSAFIGGGSAGFEGGLGGALGGGLRAPFGRNHGLVARLGLEAYLLGNDRFYSSMLEFPQGQLGYQVLTNQLLIELGGTLGPVLTGRHRRNGDSTGTLRGMLETGARLGVGFRNAHLELAYSRYERRGEVPADRLDRVTGSMCGMASAFGLCADVEYFDRQSLELPRGARDTVYFGLHVGVLTQQRTFPRESTAPPPKPRPLRRSASASIRP